MAAIHSLTLINIQPIQVVAEPTMLVIELKDLIEVTFACKAALVNSGAIEVPI